MLPTQETPESGSGGGGGDGSLLSALAEVPILEDQLSPREEAPPVPPKTLAFLEVRKGVHLAGCAAWRFLEDRNSVLTACLGVASKSRPHECHTLYRSVTARNSANTGTGY
jgi:hypothetical protein